MSFSIGVAVSTILSPSSSASSSSILELLAVCLKRVGWWDLVVVLKWSKG